MKKQILLFLLITISYTSFSQIQNKNIKLERSLLKSSINIPVVDLGELNTDELESFENKAVVACSRPCDITTKNSGVWSKRGNQKVWTVEILSPGAKGMIVYFDKFKLAPDSHLFIYINVARIKAC